MIRRGVFAILALVLTGVATAQHAPPAKADGLAAPSPAQLAWHKLEVGMFIHLAPQTWQDQETDDLSTPLSSINPDKLDTDQWAKVAKSMGAKYIVFVAKHEGGFCWWQTDTTDFSVKNTPWRAGKGDVLADLSASCKKQGLKLGAYLSPQDKKHNIGIGGKASDPAKQADYEKLFRQQLTEVLSRYGDMCEVWFDGSLVFDVGDILEAHAKNAAIFQGPQASIRWVGNEDGIAPPNAWNTVKTGAKKWGDYTAADSDKAGDRWLPIECDARMRATWFWGTKNQNTLKTVPQLMNMYEKSVGRGCGLLLNNTPDRSGLIPEADARRSAEFGAEINRVYGFPIAKTAGMGQDLTLQLRAPTTIDRVVISELLVGRGERIRKFELQGLVDAAWRPLGSGESVGHMRIVPIDPIKVEAVRLHITDSVGEPIIPELAVFSSAPPPPGAAVYPATSYDYELVWSDEFNDWHLDPTKWSHYAPGPRRDAVNDPESVRLNDRYLVIQTSRKKAQDPTAPGGVRPEYHTGMISTQGLFETTYGYFECRMMMQKEIGHWSAFWLNTPTMGNPEKDPAKAGVEIDVIEYLRNGDYADKAQHTIHWDYKTPSYQKDTASIVMPNIGDGFHTFGVEWTPEALIFFDDGRETWRTTKAIPKRDQYMILSMEVGKWADDISKAKLPDGINVDYVRVYKKKPTSPGTTP